MAPALTIPAAHRRKLRIDGVKKLGMTALVIGILLVFLLPLIYGASMSIKSKEQIAALDSSIIPASTSTFHFQDQD